MDRRKFIGGLTATGSILIAGHQRTAAEGGIGGQDGLSGNTLSQRGIRHVTYALPDLPYAYDALAPFLNEETMHLHHDKHHAGYVKALNDSEDKLQQAAQAGDFAGIRALADALAFNYSGHLLHSLFWTNMAPHGGGAPNGALAEQIAKDFGSYDTFKSEFLAASNAVQGSGWGILAWQPLGSKLAVLQAEKHQNLAQWGATPILVLDVWEHAYYLQYQNRRTEFTSKFFDVVNWQDVAQRLAKAQA
jgi:superoxide dismutase, Fe-Mn family